MITVSYYRLSIKTYDYLLTILFADKVVVMAASAKGIQQLLNISSGLAE